MAYYYKASGALSPSSPLPLISGGEGEGEEEGVINSYPIKKVKINIVKYNAISM